jgi:GTP-binding protein
MITSAKYIISSPDVKDCPQSGLPEYAFIGRSNVGKSSLINMLCHNPKLAKTSQKPGKTLLINHFLVESQESRAKSQESRVKSQEELRKHIDESFIDINQYMLNLIEQK